MPKRADNRWAGDQGEDRPRQAPRCFLSPAGWTAAVVGAATARTPTLAANHSEPSSHPCRRTNLAGPSRTVDHCV
jgi:hypothetical protein